MDTDALKEQLATLLADPRVQVAGLIVLLVVALSCCRIYSKAGYHGALGLLMLVPGINVLMLVALAFGRWPIEKQARELRKVSRVVARSQRHSRAA